MFSGFAKKCTSNHVAQFLGYALRNNQKKFCQALIESSITKKPPTDHIMMALKSARCTDEILKAVSLHCKTMEPQHVAFALNSLTHTFKKQETLSERDVLHCDEFHQLCNRLKATIRQLEPHEVIDSLKALIYFRASFDSVIMQQLLQLLRRDLNRLSIPQLTFVSFLLRRVPQSPLVDAFKIAIPLVIETQLKLKLDRTNVANLVDTLAFCSKNEISDECIFDVVTSLLALDHLEWLTMDPMRARSIIISITNLSCDWPEIQKLFLESLDVCSRNIKCFSFEDIDQIISCLGPASKKNRFFYSDVFYDRTAALLIHLRISFVECTYILRKFNVVGHVNRDLIDYTIEKLLDDPSVYLSGGFGMVKSLMGALSNANYKTQHWHVLKEILPKNNALLDVQNIQKDRPWVSLCLDFAALDIYIDSLLSTIFSEEFLSEFLSRSYNKLDYLQLSRLNEIVKLMHVCYTGPLLHESHVNKAMSILLGREKEYPLKTALESAIGGKEYVLTQCMLSSYGQLIDHAVVFRQGGNAVALPGHHQSPTILDHLKIPEGSQICAIVVLSASNYNSLGQMRGGASLNTRLLEKMGFAAVPISLEKWKATPDREKLPYLMQTIRLQCSDIFGDQLTNQNIVER